MLSFSSLFLEAAINSEKDPNKMVFKKTLIINGKKTVLTFIRDKKSRTLVVDKINNRKLTKHEQNQIMKKK